jgi:Protein of unknown function (DUF550)
MNLITMLNRARAWSFDTFGPGNRRKGVLAHIRKEVAEVEKSDGNDLEEWIDIVILAFDGAWRAGFTSHQIAAMWEAKQTKNEKRVWPDWRKMSADAPIEHVRGIHD